MICPKCKAEYRENYTTCTDCRVELVYEGENTPSADDGFGEVIIRNRKLICPICDGTQFTSRTTLLKSGDFTFFNSDLLSQGATNYICVDCGYIFWFTEPARQLGNKFYLKTEKNDQKLMIDYETSPAAIDECPICFSKIKTGEQECSNCGYKFNEH